MLSIDQALDALQEHYDNAVAALREDILEYAQSGTLPVASARATPATGVP